MTVEDKELFCRDMAARNVEVIKVENKSRFIYFLKDPDGNLIEVFNLDK